MELIFIICFALVTYIVGVYIAVKQTEDKLGARSGLFGAGIVTMFVGFIWSKLVEHLAFAGWFWFDDILLYYVMVYGFMIMGLSGIVMIAVDLLKAINEMSERMAQLK